MRLLIQRVGTAWLEWGGASSERVEGGMVCLAGFQRSDEPRILEPMAEKMYHLRIFEDGSGRMNRSLAESGGRLLLVPQFTLYADCRKGRRPGFTAAMEPAGARRMFAEFRQICTMRSPNLIAGEFGAEMRVHLVNEGPVTILLDSEELNLR